MANAAENIADRFYADIDTTLRTSTRTFYRYGDTYRTYTEARTYVDRVRATLADVSAKTVGVCAGKSFENYAAILGILLSGNAWVPLSCSMPAGRLARMADLAALSVLFVDDKAPPDFVAHAKTAGVRVVHLDSVHELSASNRPIARFNADADALIYFTSGSTGEPKGVRLTHRNYISVVHNILKTLALRKGEVFADYHDIAFVISVPIVFPCVLTEGAIAPALKPNEVLLPQKHMETHQVTVLITVPSTFARLKNAKADLRGRVALNVLILCGEPLHLDVLDYCFTYVEPQALFNFYGSTEVAPWTFHHKCTKDDVTRFSDLGIVPIGMPLPGVTVKLAPETSELLVSGENISPGYLQGLYADRFEETQGRRWYRTGDIATLFDGVYACKGRLDSQIKIDGFRVELMDIEANLRKLDGVKAAVCFLAGEGADRIIVAVLHTLTPYDLAATRKILSQRLPAYMLPRKVVSLEDVPLNNSGKVDRRALQNMYG